MKRSAVEDKLDIQNAELKQKLIESENEILWYQLDEIMGDNDKDISFMEIYFWEWVYLAQKLAN